MSDEPPYKKCPDCGSEKDQIEEVKDYINGSACEVEYLCSDCGVVVNFWAYGSWMP